MNILHLINLISVGIFGMVLSAAFCDIRWTKKRLWGMAASMAAMFLLQGILYFGIEPEIVENLYPLITHVPLIVVLCFLNRRILWPCFSVLTAYLCCQLRRWLGLCIAALLMGGPKVQDVAELILTLPILLFMVCFVAPSVRSISHYTVAEQCQFGLVPVLYYGFDYLTRIYTNLLLGSSSVVLEFMPFVCSVAYIIFVVYTTKERNACIRLEQMQGILNLQVSQSVREIEILREAQQRTRIYRHDLRHHLQYLYSCLENEQPEQAQKYIREICADMEKTKIIAFCENEAANLIFSSYARRAKEQGVVFRVRAAIPQEIPVSGNDLCVLLSNALENALCACQRMPEGEEKVIEVTTYKRDERLSLQFVNSFHGNIVFRKGIPTTENPGHGIGVQSICAVVERYRGLYSFSVENGCFVLRISFEAPDTIPANGI